VDPATRSLLPTLKPLPSLLIARTDKVDPCCIACTIDNFAPIFIAERTLIDDPKPIAAMTLIAPCSFEWAPATLNPEPILLNVLIDILDPKWHCSKIEYLPPALAKLLMLRLDPTPCTSAITESL
jgi:hypothetical protein